MAAPPPRHLQRDKFIPGVGGLEVNKIGQVPACVFNLDYILRAPPRRSALRRKAKNTFSRHALCRQ